MKSDTSSLANFLVFNDEWGNQPGIYLEKIYKGIWKFPEMHKLLLIWSRHLLAF